MRQRASVIILCEHQLLFIERYKGGNGPYYVLPGGGIEPGEEPLAAAHRELAEELGLSGLTLTPVLGSPTPYQEHPAGNWLFIGTLPAGAEPTWQEDHKQRPDNRYRVVWRHRSQLDGLDTRPQELRTILAALPL